MSWALKDEERFASRERSERIRKSVPEKGNDMNRSTEAGRWSEKGESVLEMGIPQTHLNSACQAVSQSPPASLGKSGHPSLLYSAGGQEPCLMNHFSPLPSMRFGTQFTYT